MLKVSAELCAYAISLNIPWVIENPLTSRLWLTREIAELQDQGAVFHRVDFCAYGVPWRKSTGLLAHAFDNLPAALQCCSASHGRCQFSGKKHIVLAGKNASGMWLTRIAQPYPLKLCHAVCGQLARTHIVGSGI